MTLSIWRLAHLALALVASVFLLLLSITGVILAVGAIDDKTQGYKVENFEDLNLAQTLPVLGEVFSEITELKVDHRKFVSIEALDLEGNTVKGYIDPRNGKFLGEIVPQNKFIQWNTNLHRSLFLKETGRIIIGIVSFLLFLIAISGAVLIVKRQQGLRNFFGKINKEYFAQYFHVVSGRIALIPICIIAATGAYLSVYGLGLLKHNQEHKVYQTSSTEEKTLDQFKIFQEIKLSEVEKIEFPFIPEDPEEFFILKLKSKELKVNQIFGEIVEETLYSRTYSLERLSLDLHTGRTNILWAIILGFACLNILFFIYSGFVITFKRKAPKVQNTCSKEEADTLILVGTENGSTMHFAYQVYQQLLSNGQNPYLTEMNNFSGFEKVKRIIVLTSTYGLGTAPSNATKFEELLRLFKPQHKVEFTVVGFGSRAYTDFCKYAYGIDLVMANKPWSKRLVEVHTVNDKSAVQFVSWVKAFNQETGLSLGTAPALYAGKAPRLKDFEVLDKTFVTEDNETFKLTLKPKSNITYQSGDLFAIYPANDARERLYSIGVTNGNIQLIIKLHTNGLGSEYLYSLEKGQTIKAKLILNPSFHLAQNVDKIALISNGTGIAPFLGMVENCPISAKVNLYTGFRCKNCLTQDYEEWGEEVIKCGKLNKIKFAYSREEQQQYVMDHIREDAAYFKDLLSSNGKVMICGSLSMQKDVEALLHEIYPNIEQHQILSDCY